MSAFEWFDQAFVQEIISTFVERFDQTFDAWRREYTLLSAEREEINRTLGREAGDRALEIRRRVIEHKLEAMRQGKRHYYSYRYLSSQGFLPNYGFPRRTVRLVYFFSGRFFLVFFPQSPSSSRSTRSLSQFQPPPCPTSSSPTTSSRRPRRTT